MKPITEEEHKQIVRLYKNPDLTLQEIANIVGLAESTVNRICRECFDNGTLKPRVEFQRTVSKKRRFTDEQLAEIAKDYYENGLSATETMQKYGMYPMQMQQMRDKFGEKYGLKPWKKAVVQYTKDGEKVAEYRSALSAQRATGLTNIDKCCKGTLKTCGGFVWKYKETTNATAD